MTLAAIRDCFDGLIPSLCATAGADGTPNVCYLSNVEYVDPEHVALSFQFFNKTRRNVLENPHALVAISDPETAATYRIRLRYLRTETSGPLFERMRAKLASIASFSGLTHVFKLLGADVYRVESLEQAPGPTIPRRTPERTHLPALRAVSDVVARANDLESLFERVLAALAEQFGIEHSMVLMLDPSGDRFFAVASRGYGTSGVGAEIPSDAGAIGIAARRRTPIRIVHATADYAYVRAIRERAEKDPAWAGRLETAIPLPGLPNPHSQLAVPIEAGDDVLGVIYVESAELLRFSHRDEDALCILAKQMGLAMRALSCGEDESPARDVQAPGRDEPAPGKADAPLRVRHYAADDSVFLGDDYLIKGVAGAILGKLVREYASEGREHFTNRELRLDKTLSLPAICDNLEARLVLLERRLRDRDAGLRIERTARGRFRLVVSRPLVLERRD